MALYTTFGEMVTDLRAEARLSTNPSVGSAANTRYKTLLNRVYEMLYDDYDWPHLNYVSPRQALAAGQQYYDFPAGMNMNRMSEVVAWWGSEPYPIDPGIGFQEYSAFSSEDDERADPPQRYALRSETAGSTQYEIWPLPASDDVTLQFTGIRAMTKLVNSSDVCLIDDKAVVLYAASEVLRPISSDDADAKLAAAGQRLRQCRARAVQPQTGGASAPSVGTGDVSVGMRGRHAVVSVGRG